MSEPQALSLNVDDYIEKTGGLTAEGAAEIRRQLNGAQADLTEMREKHPDWAEEINAAIAGFNDSEPEQTEAALVAIETLIAKRRENLRDEEAKTKRARATLVYTYDYAKAEPLLCAAATLAATDIWYWIECSRMRRKLGLYPPALAAIQTARSLAKAQDDARNFEVAGDDLGDLLVINGRHEEAETLFREGLATARARAEETGTPEALRDLSVSLNKIGDAARTRGDHAAAKTAYDESLNVARQLSDQLGTPEAMRDLSVSLHRMTAIAIATDDLPAARAHYAEALIPTLHPLHIEEIRAAFDALAPYLQD